MCVYIYIYIYIHTYIHTYIHICVHNHPDQPFICHVLIDPLSFDHPYRRSKYRLTCLLLAFLFQARLRVLLNPKHDDITCLTPLAEHFSNLRDPWMLNPKSRIPDDVMCQSFVGRWV